MTWTTTDVQIAFDKAQPTYDLVATIQRKAANHLVTCLPNLDPKMIVDLGAGTGFVTDALLQVYPHSQYHLIDLSEKMIQGCQEKYAPLPQMSFDTDDMDSCLLPESDLIISNLAVQWSRDFPALLAKLTTKSCVVAFTTLVQGTFQEWADLLHINDIDSPLLPFTSTPELSTLCHQITSNCKIEVHDYQMTFTTISDFIQYLRDLGATSGNGIKNKAKFKALIQNFTDPITVTYKIFFCVLDTTSK